MERPPTAPADARRPRTVAAGMARPATSEQPRRTRNKRRPATAAEVPDATRSLQGLTGQLADLQRRGKYLEAAQVRDELDRLRSAGRDATSQRWIQRHTESLRKLPLNERAVRHAIESSWKERAEVHAADMRRLSADMAGRHEAEVTLFRDALRRDSQSRAPKFSRALLEMQEREATLAKTHQYELAKKVRGDIEKQVKRELKQLDAQRVARAEARVGRLRTQHRREREILVEKSSMALDRMMAERDKELQQAQVRFRAANHELEHALSLQIASHTQGCGSVQEAALGASRRGEATAAAAATFHGDRRHDGPPRRRPKTAPLGPVRVAGAMRRSQSAGPASRGGRPTTAPMRSASTRRRRRKGVRRVGGKAMTCDWCSSGKGYMATHDGVQIPRESAAGGVGKFCTWECAKSWNNMYTPVMQRWVRNMFIDDVAGYMVTASQKKHVEKKLANRG